MKKILIIIITLSFCLGGCGNTDENTNEQQNNNYTAYRTVTLDDTNNYINNDNDTNTNTNYSNDNNNTESEISSFSTKVYTPNDSARQNNIQITCSELNETIVKSRRNFFFLRYCWKSYS